jgi:Rieske Fe-S protein
MKRRAGLALLGGLLGAACAEPDRRARVPLASLARGARVVIEHGGEVIEVQRDASGLVARSLTCSHYGCRVQWLPERQVYSCPCHQGEFDAAGRPKAGAPTKPLRTFPIVAVGDLALVGEP